MEHRNPFDDPQQDCLVLRNPQQQYSLWPAFSALPAGWHAVYGPQPQPDCLSWLEQNWDNIRPVAQDTHRSDNV